MPEQVSFAAAMPRDAAPGLTLAWGVIPSGSIPIEIRWCSGWSHRPGVRPWYVFDGAGSVGGGVKSHRSRSGVRPQCHLMPKAPSKTRDFDWKGTVQTDYLEAPLMHFIETQLSGPVLEPVKRRSSRIWVRWDSVCSTVKADGVRRLCAAHALWGNGFAPCATFRALSCVGRLHCQAAWVHGL